MNTAYLRSIALLALLLAISFPASASRFSMWSNNDYTKTRYPIVLAHGFMGFDSLLSLVDYWPGIVSDLEQGGARVFVTKVSAVNSSTVRGEQLLAQIEQIIAITGAEKVNLIGHSQGSLDARYVASVRPELIASITSVGGPHGASVTQLKLDSGVYNGLITTVGKLISLLSANTNPMNVENFIQLFSTQGIAAFNRDFPIGLPDSPCGEGAAVAYVDGHAIRVYSWGGTAIFTNPMDLSDVLFAATGAFIDGKDDGLITRCDNHLGDVIRDDFYMNHLDLTNMMFGLSAIFATNPKSVFRSHANRLKNAGL